LRNRFLSQLSAWRTAGDIALVLIHLSSFGHEGQFLISPGIPDRRVGRTRLTCNGGG